MIDGQIRRLIDPLLDRAAVEICRTSVTANQVTVAGFVIGLLSVPLLAAELYLPALAMILINRVMDGLDGAIARYSTPTDTGAYLDIVLDFVFYSAVVFGFCLAQPENALSGAFLIFSFVGTGSSFLAFSIFAAKHNLTTAARGTKSFYYLGGLTEGFETILLFVIVCLFPAYFWLLAMIFGVLCWITTTTRILTSVDALKSVT